MVQETDSIMRWGVWQEGVCVPGNVYMLPEDVETSGLSSGLLPVGHVKKSHCAVSAGMPLRIP